MFSKKSQPESLSEQLNKARTREYLQQQSLLNQEGIFMNSPSLEALPSTLKSPSYYAPSTSTLQDTKFEKNESDPQDPYCLKLLTEFRELINQRMIKEKQFEGIKLPSPSRKLSGEERFQRALRHLEKHKNGYSNSLQGERVPYGLQRTPTPIPDQDSDSSDNENN